MQITKEQYEFLENFLIETELVICDLDCNYRISNFGLSGETDVFEFDEPIKPNKSYKNIKDAINFLIKNA